MLDEEEKEPPHIHMHRGRHDSIINKRPVILSSGEITGTSFSLNLNARPEMCPCRQREFNYNQAQHKLTGMACQDEVWLLCAGK